MRHNLTSTLSITAMAIIATNAFAQTPPDAGALRQQIEQNQQQQLPPKALPAKPAEPAAMQPQQGVLTIVKSFAFAGNTLLTSAQLTPVVASYLNRPLDFAELQKAVSAVAEAYRSQGWIVRTYLPAQDIVDGVVTIQIVEAVFGSLKIEGNPAKHIAEEQIKNLFTARQIKGAPLNVNPLDRSLLLADDLPGVAVSGSLKEGASAAETDLILKLADEAFVVGEVGMDNIGSRSTGSNRLTTNLNLNSPLDLADLFSGNFIHTSGSDYLRLAYNLPVGTDGWRVGANLSTFSYKLVAAEFEAMNAKGASTTIGLEANYPIIRSRLKNLYVGLNYDRKRFNNEANQVISSSYQIDNYSVGLNGNLFDNLAGGGANSFYLGLYGGNVNLGNLDSQENVTLNGGFNKLRYNATRQQVITESVSLFVALSGQETGNKNLDSSEKFYLGGAGGVRAYPASEGGGSRGKLINLELRKRLPKGFNLTGFYDYGDVGNLDNSASYSLKGVGASLAWQAEFGLNLKATIAQRIGGNPNPTATGNDQDGALIKSRWWLTASMPF